MNFKKIAAGIYETTDGAYQIRKADTSCGGWGWDLRELDEFGGWEWMQRYPTKGEAQEGLRRHLGWLYTQGV